MTTDDSNPSRLSFSRSAPSSIRFNRVFGNIGAPLRDGSLGFEEDEGEDVVVDEAEEAMQEMRRIDEERHTVLSSTETMHDVAKDGAVHHDAVRV